MSTKQIDLFRTNVVEIFGLPRTGKTSSIEALSHSLRQVGVAVDVIRERASLCPIHDKMSPLFNFWTALSQLREYVEVCDRGVEVVFADRGILDSAVWLECKNGSRTSSKEWEQFEPLLYNSFMNARTAVAVFLTADIELVLQRERETRLDHGLGTVVNGEVLRTYLNAFRHLKSRLARLVPVYEIDVTTLDLRTTLYQVGVIVHERLRSAGMRIPAHTAWHERNTRVS